MLKNYVFMFIISFVFLACSNNENSGNDDYENESSRLRRDESSRSTPARCSESKNDNVTITEADDITSRNAGVYEISGRCSSNQGKVELNIEGGQQDVICSGNRWKTFVDVTSVVQGKEEVQISARNGEDSACSVVKNFFQCPEGYAPVPRLTKDSDINVNYDFCVMIYEARSETSRRSSYRSRESSSFQDRRDTQRNQEEVRREYNEKAVSKSGDDPWVDIPRGEAERRCSNNGSGYELMTNNEWQIIARNIELEPSNWSLGHRDVEAGNYLNRGLLSLGSRRDSGYSGGGSSSRWEDSKRTHALPNGEELWDISGGVWEMVADTVSTLKSQGMQSTNQRYIYELTGNNKKLFGPKRDYSSVGRSRGSVYNQGQASVGLGGVRLSRFNDIVVRGGAGENDGGVFAVDASVRSEGYNIGGGGIGFRCIYHP